MDAEGDGVNCGMPRLATVVWLTIFAIVLGGFAGAIYFWATEGDIHV